MTWFDEECEWLAREAPALGRKLMSSSASEAVRACRDLGGHALFREEVVGYLVVGLERREASVQKATCEALERARGISAAPDIVQLLMSEDAAVREAAARALEALTDAQLGEDLDAWQTWISG